MMVIIKEEESINFDELRADFPNLAEVLEPHQNKDWKFQIQGKRLKLLHSEYKPIFIDIENKLQDHKRYFFKNSPFKENLAKALGHKNMNEAPQVLDATGGMLSDTILMYAMGIQDITVTERHPLAQVLIQNALDCYSTTIKFNKTDAMNISDKYEVIYFDPMYDEVNKKSSANKLMTLFRDHIGVDHDAASVAKHLKSLSTKRLVIKRPIKSKPLLDGVSIEFKGKSTRYDVYISL